MAATFTTIIGSTIFGFDWVNQYIEIDASTTIVTAADLKLAIHDAQDQPEDGMPNNQIAKFSNPVVLTTTSSTFLVVKLLEQWKILPLATSGALVVQDGNTVNENTGIHIFAYNPLVTKVNNTSAAGVLVESGTSGLTSSESATITELSAAVSEIHTRLALDPANPWTDTPTVSSDSNTTIIIDNTGDGLTTSTGTRRQ